MDLVDGKIGGSNTWFKGLLGEFQKYVRYSIHPKARPFRLSNGHFRPVPGI